MHPFITVELVRQRRAALDAEADRERLARAGRIRRRQGHDAAVAANARTLVRRVRALAARPS